MCWPRPAATRNATWLRGRERTVIAFFADETAPKLLGAQTLETFGLGVDPLGRRLVSVDAYLAASANVAFFSQETARSTGL